MQKLVTFVKDSYNEMVHHVTWASYSELQSSSVLILVASLILTMVIWVMDITFSGLLNVFYNYFR